MPLNSALMPQSPFLESVYTKAPKAPSYGDRLLDDLSNLSVLQGISLPLTAPLTAGGGAVRGLSFGLLDPTQEIEGMLGDAAPPESVADALEIAGEIGGSFVPYVGAASSAHRFFKGASVAQRLLRGAFTFAAPELLDQTLHGELHPKRVLRSAATGATFSLPLSRPLLAPTVAASELLMGASPLEAGVAGGVALLLGPMEGKLKAGDATKETAFTPVVDTDLAALRALHTERVAAKESAEAFKTLGRSGLEMPGHGAIGWTQRVEAPVSKAVTQQVKDPITKVVESVSEPYLQKFAQKPKPKQIELPFQEPMGPKSQVEIIKEAAKNAGAVTDDVVAEALGGPMPLKMTVRPIDSSQFGTPGDRFSIDSPQGFLRAKVNGNDVGISVLTDKPRQGIGTQLYERLGEELFKRGVTQPNWTSEPASLQVAPAIKKLRARTEARIQELLSGSMGLPAGVRRTEAKVAGNIDEVLFETADNSFLGVRFPEPGKAVVGMTRVPKGRRNMGQALKLWKALQAELEMRGVSQLEATSVTDSRLQRIMDRWNARTPAGDKLLAEAAKVELLSKEPVEKLSSALVRAVENKGPEAPDTKTIQRALAEAKGGYVPPGAPTKNSMPPAVKGPDVSVLDEVNPFVQKDVREKILGEMRAQGPLEATKAAQLELLYQEARNAKEGVGTSFAKANELLGRQRKIKAAEVVEFQNQKEAMLTFTQELASMRTAGEIDAFMERLPAWYRRGTSFEQRLAERAKDAKKLAELVAKDTVPSIPSNELADYGLMSAAVKGGFSAVNAKGQPISRVFKNREDVVNFVGRLEAGLEQPKNLADLRALAHSRSVQVEYQNGSVRIIEPTGAVVYADTMKEATELVRRVPRLLESAPELMSPSLPRAPGPGNVGGRSGGQAPPNCPVVLE